MQTLGSASAGMGARQKYLPPYLREPPPAKPEPSAPATTAQPAGGRAQVRGGGPALSFVCLVFAWESDLAGRAGVIVVGGRRQGTWMGRQR